MISKIRYFCEAALLSLLLLFFKILPVEKASAIGGWIARKIGPRMGASRRALLNMKRAFPDLSDDEYGALLNDMWDHFGRIIAEYPHIRNIAKNRTVIEGKEYLEPLLGDDQGAIFAGAHIGNWEVGCAAPFLQLGVEVDSAYRAPNNPWVERLLLNARTLNKRLRSYSKSSTGGRALFKAAKEKRNIVILFDQKYNEGINVPFFGNDAMTNPAFVQIAQKYGLSVVPVQIIREDNARFRLIVHPPMSLNNEDGSKRAIEDVALEAHQMLEVWIRQNPAQWIWLHRRWKED